MKNNEFLVPFLVIMMIILVVPFLWYYVTLPGSKLSPIKDQPKPTIEKAMKSYVLYIIPMAIINIYVMTKLKLY
jgi:hypothetical protein